MSHTTSRKIVAHSYKPVNAWDKAIEDARKMIEETKIVARARVADLKLAIRRFEMLRDCGQPFPGEASEKTGEVNSN
jgi:hypothetical protein